MQNKTYKVLIVDDSDVIQLLLKNAFKNTSYEVSTIGNPLTAYQMIEDEHYDIVISDIVMPEMDGLTLLKKIKGFNGMIQVLIITAHASINMALDAFRYGATDIFLKPFEDMSEIINTVDQTVAKLDRVDNILHKIAQEKRDN